MVGEGKGANRMIIQVDGEKLKEVLTECRQYIITKKIELEAMHDDPPGDFYMDLDVWERMKEADFLINKINDYL